MLLHNNGRWYIGKLSFVLPDNICLLTDDACVYFPNGMELVTPDEAINISLHADTEALTSKDFLDDLVDNIECFIRKSEAKSVCVGGLNGHYIYYESGTHFHCEYRFNSGESEQCNGISIHIYVDKRVDIVEIAQGKLVQQLIQSVRAE